MIYRGNNGFSDNREFDELVRLIDLDEDALAKSPAMRSLLDVVNPIYDSVKKGSSLLDNYTKRDKTFRDYLQDDDPEDSQYMLDAVNGLRRMVGQLKAFIEDLKVDINTKMLVPDSRTDLLIKKPRHARPFQDRPLMGTRRRF